MKLKWAHICPHHGRARDTSSRQLLGPRLSPLYGLAHPASLARARFMYSPDVNFAYARSETLSWLRPPRHHLSNAPVRRVAWLPEGVRPGWVTSPRRQVQFRASDIRGTSNTNDTTAMLRIGSYVDGLAETYEYHAGHLLQGRFRKRRLYGPVALATLGELGVSTPACT